MPRDPCLISFAQRSTVDQLRVAQSSQSLAGLEELEAVNRNADLTDFWDVIDLHAPTLGGALIDVCPMRVAVRYSPLPRDRSLFEGVQVLDDPLYRTLGLHRVSQILLISLVVDKGSQFGVALPNPAFPHAGHPPRPE